LCGLHAFSVSLFASLSGLQASGYHEEASHYSDPLYSKNRASDPH
jgi:hypothetical protein